MTRSTGTAPPHPIHRRYRAEDLVRRRRADEPRRFVASQRAGCVDPNPHQIDAVIFALARLPEGGAILADEVGLGKTIEAGLVIAQVRSEGWRRVLLVTPKPLLGQWRQELAALFHLDVHEAGADPETLRGEGVFALGRELAGGERGAAALAAAERFDLCVIDEAHEVFAGIYKRFERAGAYDESSAQAVTAARLRAVLERSATPVLLLTATPIQNSLAELWGLVQYVDPSTTLLGDLPTFREMFCAGDDRRLREGQEHELRRRIATVCRRALRRQAQEFLTVPFVSRQARLFEYSMTAEERELYEDVTRYLLEPGICAFRGGQRRLLLIGFHRRMASSVRALASSLDRVAERLRRMIGGGADDAAAEFGTDLEDDAPEAGETGGRTAAEDDVDVARARAELARVQSFSARAAALPTDSKARALLRAVRLVLERGRSGEGSGKLVVFTESLTTQDYLRELLVASGLVAEAEVTLFRGQNDGERAAEALRRWEREVGAELSPRARPSRAIAVRLALVHEFATRSRVLISTEAGAKGLNLQFCETLVNYDLPWNPQRIEQRIGRCHRYGQRRGVTVINFLNRDNAAQRLTYEILSQKLDLFGTVLDASDAVLHEPGEVTSDALASAIGPELEAELARIYQRARSMQEVEAELQALRGSLDDRRQSFEDTQRRTVGLIESRLDEEVRQVFRRLQEEVPRGLRELDDDVLRVATGYLDAAGIDYRCLERDGRTGLALAADPALPGRLAEGGTVWCRSEEGGDTLHPGHPLIEAALGEARSATAGPLRVRFGPPAPGRRGRMVVLKVCYRGFETVERLLPVAVVAGQAGPLAPEVARELLLGPTEDAGEAFAGDSPPGDAVLQDAVEELLFVDQVGAAERERERFECALEQVERFLEDRVLLLRRRRRPLERKLEQAERRRDDAVGAEAAGGRRERGERPSCRRPSRGRGPPAGRGGGDRAAAAAGRTRRRDRDAARS